MGWLEDFGLVLRATRELRASKKASPPMGEVGATGCNVCVGIINEEYNTKLARVADRMLEFKMMRYSDAASSVVENMVMLPIRAAKWWVEPGDKSGAQDNMASAMNANFFGGMSHTWDDFLRHALLAVFNGFGVHEKVWEQRDGLIQLRKLAPRDPDTHYKWIFDDMGGLKAWAQRGYRPEGEMSSLVTVTIPIEKLLVLTFRGEYGNPEGFGILRPMFKHHYMKDALYKLAAIHIERRATGVPIAYPTGTLSPSQRQTVLDILKNVKGYESSGIVMPSDVKIEAFELGKASVEFMDFIIHQHQMILQAAMCQVAGLGQDTNTGTWALSRTFADLMLLGFEAIAKWFAEAFQTYVVKQWVDYNYGVQTVYPTLQHSNIRVLDRALLAELIQRLWDPKMELDRFPEIDSLCREVVGLPQNPRVQEALAPAPEEKPEAEEPGPEGEASDSGNGSTLTFAADAPEDETSINAKLRWITGRLTSQYIERLRPLAEQQKFMDMQTVRVPLLGALETAVYDWLWQVAQQAAERLTADTGEPVELGRAAKQIVKAKAALLAERIGANIKWIVVNGLVEDIQAKVPKETAIRNADARVAERLSASLSGVMPELAAEIVEGMQL